MAEPPKQTLHIVYAADHSYMLYCCVSILSLLEHLPEGCELKLHLLIDESFCGEDARLLNFLKERFPHMRLQTHRIQDGALPDRDDSLWSRAACFRLLLPELLREADVCLYLDSDTLIVGDITALWQTDLTDTYVAGVFDDIAPVREHTVADEIPGIDTYINSGVLLMNLALMRERNIQRELLKDVKKYLVVDQDLLNVCCYGHIRLLSPEYNCIPGVYAETPRILHFLLRDYLRPWKNLRSDGAAAWWACAQQLRLVADVDRLRERADWYQRGSISWIFRRCADYRRIYVLGSGEDAKRIHRALRLGKCRGLCPVLEDEEAFSYDSETLIIHASRKKDLPGLNRFLAHPGAERQVIWYNRRPVSYYNLLPASCRREVYGELLMWETGVNGRGVMTPAALLEIDAARCPDREAYIEYTGGTRSAVTFRELNREANRIANAIVRGKPERGARIRPDRDGAGPSGRFAAVLGIWKSGCVYAPDPAAKAAGLPHPCPENDALACRAPAAEPLPDEPAYCSGTAQMTGRALTEASERLRERIAWNAQDALLLEESDDSPAALPLRIAALFTGSAVVTLSEPEPRELLRILNCEACTVLALRVKTVERLTACVEDMHARGEAVSMGKCRLLLSEGISEALLARWRRAIPYVPVNGQGFHGAFRYDCEWYMG